MVKLFLDRGIAVNEPGQVRRAPQRRRVAADAACAACGIERLPGAGTGRQMRLQPSHRAACRCRRRRQPYRKCAAPRHRPIQAACALKPPPTHAAELHAGAFCDVGLQAGCAQSSAQERLQREPQDGGVFASVLAGRLQRAKLGLYSPSCPGRPAPRCRMGRRCCTASTRRNTTPRRWRSPSWCCRSPAWTSMRRRAAIRTLHRCRACL